MREYMRLLLGAVISNNTLFNGDVDCRYLRHNLIELNIFMLVRCCRCHSFMVDQRHHFLLSQLLTIFCMD